MVATFCGILVSGMKYLQLFNTEFGEGSVDDHCENFELLPEPRPEEKSSNLAEIYQKIFNALKTSGLGNNNIYGNLING